VAPDDRDVHLRIDRVLAGSPDSGPAIASICWPNDDRVGIDDNRVGRLTRTVGMNSVPFCTAWRIANGYLLTAGHCADFDPDGNGALLPDGVLDMAGFVEFRVPASTATGNLVLAHVNDQYPVDLSSVNWRFDGTGLGLGKDWAVFRVNANANTRLLPHQAYGPPFRVTRELPEANELLRVTGFGTDAGTANQTNQTHTGQYLLEAISGDDIRIDHMVDTMSANSGSPLIWEEMNLAIGIHTNGGCNSAGTTSNSGTSFEVDALENAINDAPGTQTIYLDLLHPMRVAEDGTLFRPYQLLPAALAATPTGGILSMYEGFYGVARGTILNRAMTLQAPAGPVLIIAN
jgi:V8-like Glu-specific endopeptidase